MTDSSTRNAVLSWGLALMAFLLPLLITPHITDDAFLLPKQVLFIAGIFLWRLLHFLLTTGAEPHKTRRTPTLYPLIAFVFIYLLTAGPYRMDHVVTVGAGGYLLLLVSHFFRDLQDPRLVLFPEEGRRHRDRPFEFAVAAGVIVALYVILQDYGIDLFRHRGVVRDWRGVLVATLGNPNHVGGFLALLLPYVTIRLLRAPGGWPLLFWSLVALVLTTAMVLVFTVGAWLGIFAALVLAPVFAWAFRVRLAPDAPDAPEAREAGTAGPSLAFRLLWMGSIVAVVVLFYFTPNPLNNKDDTIWEQATASPQWTTGTGARRWIWGATARMAADHPLTGAGEYLRVYQTYAGQAYAARQHDPHDKPDVSRVDHAHFEIFETFAVNGALGGLALLWLLLAFGKALPRSFRRAPEEERPILLACLLALCISLVHSFASFQWHIPSNAFLALLFAARLEAPALPARRLPARQRCGHEVVTMAFFVALGLLIAAALFFGSWSLRQGIRLAADSPVRAEKMFQQAVLLSLGSDAPRFYAIWLVRQERFADAIPVLTEWDRRETNMEARYQLARVHERLNERAAAAAWMRRVLELNPTWPEYHVELGHLTADPRQRGMAWVNAARLYLRARDRALERANAAPNAMEAGRFEGLARQKAAGAAEVLRLLDNMTASHEINDLARKIGGRPLDPSTTADFDAIEWEQVLNEEPHVGP